MSKASPSVSDIRSQLTLESGERLYNVCIGALTNWKNVYTEDKEVCMASSDCSRLSDFPEAVVTPVAAKNQTWGREALPRVQASSAELEAAGPGFMESLDDLLRLLFLLSYLPIIRGIRSTTIHGPVLGCWLIQTAVSHNECLITIV